MMISRLLKKALLMVSFAIFSLLSSPLSAQAPEGVNYQAIARDVNGNALVNRMVSVRFSIISNNANGTLLYQERYDMVTTNDFGLFNLVIGQGGNTNAGSVPTFDQIDWSADSHFLQVEVDAGSGFEDLGTTQLLSVPYALYAKSAGNQLKAGDGISIRNDSIFNDGDTSNTNEAISRFELVNDSLLILNEGLRIDTVDLSVFTDVLVNQNLTLSETGNLKLISITNGNNIQFSVADGDSSSVNEIQNLSVNANGDSLLISQGQGIAISDLGISDNQQLTFNPARDSILLQNGGGVDISDIRDSINNYNSRININDLNIATNQTAIAANAQGIIDSTNNLNLSLLARINSDSLARYINDTTIQGELRDTSAVLRALISSSGSDDQQLSFNPARDSILLEDGSGVSIRDIRDSIANYDLRILTNQADIAANQTAVAANAQGIIDSTNNLNLSLLSRINSDSLSRFINDTTLSGQLRDTSAVLRSLINSIVLGADDQQLSFNAARDSILLEDGSGVSIRDIRDSLANYDLRILTNEADIAINQADIASNQIAIAANAQGIIDSTNNLNLSLLARINSDSLARYINDTTLSGQLRDTSAVLRSLITSSGSDDQQLSFNAARDSILLEDGSGVSIRDIRDSLANYDLRILTNQADIAANQTAIAANAQGIIDSTNNLNLSLLARINSDSLARYINDTTLSGQLRDTSAVLRSLITSSGSDDQQLSFNAARDSILLEDGSGVSIRDIRDSLANYDIRILTNQADIALNQADIANNQTAIAANAQGIIDSTNNLNLSLLVRINSDSLARYINDTTLSGQLRDTSAVLRSLITSSGSDDQQLSFNAARDSILLEDGSGVSIRDIRDSLANYDLRILTNQADIALNQADIATNQTAIAANAQGIIDSTNNLNLSLLARINSDSLARYINDTTLAGQLRDTSAVLRSLIGNTNTDDQQLSFNAARDSILLEDGSGVSIADIRDSLSNYDIRILTNEADIALNQADIATNQTAIAANAQGIIDSTNNLNLSLLARINSDSLARYINDTTLAGQLRDTSAVLRSLIGNTNTDDQQLSFNAARDSILLEDGSGVSIADIRDSLSNYDIRILTNEADIALNQADIATNQTAIAANAQGIIDSTNNLNLSLLARINSDSLARYINDTTIQGELRDTSAVLRSLIGNTNTDDQQLSFNAARDSILLEDGSGVSIADIRDSLANYDLRILTNEADIALNQVDIATNQTAIAANAQGIIDSTNNLNLSLLARINSDSLARYINDTTIQGELRDTSAVLRSLIGNTNTDDQLLSFNAARDSILLEDGSGVSIADIRDSLSNYDLRILTNETDIALNQADIATNQSAIAANAQGIIDSTNNLNLSLLARINSDSLVRYINDTTIQGELRDTSAVLRSLIGNTNTDDQLLSFNAARDSILLEDGSGVSIRDIRDSLANYDIRILTNETDIATNNLNIGVNTSNINVVNTRVSNIESDLNTHRANDLDTLATNELNTTFQVNGSNLELSDAGGTLSVPLTNLNIGDNLGNHTATQNIQLGNNWLSNDGDNEGFSLGTDGSSILSSSASEPLTIQGTDTNNYLRINSFSNSSGYAGILLTEPGPAPFFGIKMFRENGQNAFRIGSQRNGVFSEALNIIDYSTNIKYLLADTIEVSSAYRFPTQGGINGQVLVYNNGDLVFQNQNTGTDNQNLNATADSILIDNGRGAYIGDIRDSLTSHNSRINNNVANIATNASDIATNTTDIGTNQTNIASNTTVINNHVTNDLDTDTTNELITSAILNGTDLEITDAGGLKTVDLSSLALGDNLGNHTATTNLQLSNNFLSNDGDNEGISVGFSGNVRVLSNSSSFSSLEVNSTDTANFIRINSLTPNDGYAGIKFYEPILNPFGYRVYMDPNNAFIIDAIDGPNVFRAISIVGGGTTIESLFAKSLNVNNVYSFPTSIGNNGDVLVLSGNQLQFQAQNTGTDDQGLSINATQDSILIEDGTGVSIQYLLDSLSGQRADINTNASGIATNSTAISTNQTDIATNTTDIATNTTDIATNTTDIATNTSDIATNASNITTNATTISTHITNDLDTDATNELITSTNLNGTDLEITDAGGTQVIDLSSLGGTDNQNLSLNATQDSILIEDGTGVSIQYLLDSLSGQRADINTNVSGIATNSTAISTNQTDIATNTTDIATNTTDIATNTTDIATNTSDIATNASDITTNATAISTHVTNDLDTDATNELITSTNLNGTDLEITDAGGTQVIDLSSLSGTDNQGLSINATQDSILIEDGTGVSIQYLLDSLSGQRADINTNASGIATNSTAISTNQTDIATNTTDIATNTTDIATNTTDIATNTSDIATNASNITTNATAISNHITNDLDTDATNELITSTNLNGTDLEITDAGGTQVIDLSSLSGTDNQGLSINATQDSILIEDGTGVSIQYLLDSLSGQRADINTNASGIATNSTAISTNQTDIATNTTDIATNTTDIATNTTDIATNTSDIATNASNITTNATAISNHVTNDLDTDATNEIQTLSFDNTIDQLTISGTGGNTVDLSSIRDSSLTDLADSAAAIRAAITIAGDNLGNHTASTNIQLAGNYLSNDGDNEGILIDNNGLVGMGAAANTSSQLYVQTTSDKAGYFSQQGTSPVKVGVFGEVSGVGTSAFAVEGDAFSTATSNYGIHGVARGAGTNNYGVYGKAISGTNNWAGYFDLGDVFITDTLRLNNPFTLTDGAAAGRVLTSDANGVATWQAISFPADNDWDTSAIAVYNTSKNIGIGTALPNAKLAVRSLDSMAVNIGLSGPGSSSGGFGRALNISNTQSGPDDNVGIWTEVNTSPSSNFGQVIFAEGGTEARGLIADATNGSVENRGVQGFASGGPMNKGIVGFADANGLDTAIAIYGEANGTGITYAGYFRSGNVLINDTLVLPTGASAGSVLTSDANGKASWQPTAGDNLGNHIATQNIQTNGNYISNDGDNEGIFIDPTGSIGIGTTPVNTFFIVEDSTQATALYESSRFISTGTATPGVTQRTLSAYNDGTNGFNTGMFGVSRGTSVGANTGVYGWALNGQSNTGISGNAGDPGAGANFAIGARGQAIDTTAGINYGVYGHSANSSFINRGVVGVIEGPTTFNDAAVYGIANGTGNNISIYGRANNSNASGTNFAIYANATGGATNFAAYFASGLVQINDTLIMPNGAVAGAVLTSDASGRASWVSMDTASCPVGMTNVGGRICIENDQRAAANWFTAASTCVANGYKLPSWGEWYGAMDNVTVNDETNDWEWVDDGTSNTVRKVGNAALTNTANDDPAAGSAAYRCILILK